MRLAVGQPPVRDSVDGNVRAAADLVAEAGEQGARVVLFAELALSGYRVSAVAAEPDRWAVSLTDPRLEPLIEAAERSAVSVAVGAALIDGKGLHNAMLWVRADGAVEHAYSKIHLWDSERAVFTAGDRQAVVHVHGLRLGLGICYDAGFPEFTRAYGRAGVDAVLFSSAFAVGSEQHRYDIYHQARALENGVHVAVANSVGTVDGAEFFGRSRIFDRTGRMALELPPAHTLGAVELRADTANSEIVPYLSDLRMCAAEPQQLEG